MKKSMALALTASVTLCLSACATDFHQTRAVLDDVGPALQVVVTQDAQAGLIDQATADRIVAYIGIVQQAVEAVGAGDVDCAGDGKAGCSAAAAGRALAFAQQVVMEAPVSGLLSAGASAQIASHIEAGQRALLAAQDAAAAGQAQTEQERAAAAVAAVIQVNAALLTALSTTRL